MLKVKDLALTAIFMAVVFMMAWIPFLGYVQFFVVGFTTIHAVVIAFILIKDEWKYAFFGGLFFGLSSLLIAFIRPSSPLDYLFQNPLISVLPRILFGFATLFIYRFLKVVAIKTVVFYSFIAFSLFLISVLILNVFSTPSGENISNKMLDVQIGNINLAIFLAAIVSVILTITISIIAHKYRFTDKMHIGIAAFFGTFIHSVLVLGALWIYDGITNEIGFSFSVVVAILTTNSVIEILVATLVAISVVPAVKKYLRD